MIRDSQLSIRILLLLFLKLIRTSKQFITPSMATAHTDTWYAIANEINDAMVHNLSIASIGVQCWFNRLSFCLQQVAMK